MNMFTQLRCTNGMFTQFQAAMSMFAYILVLTSRTDVYSQCLRRDAYVYRGAWMIRLRHYEQFTNQFTQLSSRKSMFVRDFLKLNLQEQCYFPSCRKGRRAG